ncbi:hypothetical protein Fot_32172 [Forsythia ovata]|uniref:Uncharacterized protein n=1 Tax=Forsythia ovata TaxID=205694 RepID=A0ABD1T753_9LAMI
MKGMVGKVVVGWAPGIEHRVLKIHDKNVRKIKRSSLSKWLGQTRERTSGQVRTRPSEAGYLLSIEAFFGRVGSYPATKAFGGPGDCYLDLEVFCGPVGSLPIHLKPSEVD